MILTLDQDELFNELIECDEFRNDLLLLCDNKEVNITFGDVLFSLENGSVERVQRQFINKHNLVFPVEYHVIVDNDANIKDLAEKLIEYYRENSI